MASVKQFQVTFDCAEPERVARFWCEVLGYVVPPPPEGFASWDDFDRALPPEQQGSAFALDPRREPPVDWLCSDVICYPQRLLQLVQRWLDAGTVRNVICTIKFQGATDHEATAQFAAIPGAEVIHLHHNKHELTFLLC